MDNDLPEGIKPGPDGAKSYTGPRTYKGAPESVDSLIRADAPLQHLILDIAGTGSQPTISLEDTTEPNLSGTATGSAAKFVPAKGSVPEHIEWNTGQVDFAIDYGKQSDVHILFHEYDHAWYDHQVKTYYDLRRAYSPTMSATLRDASGKSTTYTWRIYSVDKGGHITQNDDGLKAYQHMLIHDDLVKVYGRDRTGALREALQGAEQPPNAQELDQAAATFDSIRPAFPPASGTQKGRPAAAPSVEHTHDESLTSMNQSTRPFPRGATVTGRVLELSQRHLLMETSYGTYRYDVLALRADAADVASFDRSLENALRSGDPVTIAMSNGVVTARQKHIAPDLDRTNSPNIAARPR